MKTFQPQHLTVKCRCTHSLSEVILLINLIIIIIIKVIIIIIIIKEYNHML